jgi:hypothetical protein
MQLHRLFTAIVISLTIATLHASQSTTPWYQSNLHNPYPDELSFCIVDLKFDGEKIKICEFGQGLGSTFKGYDALYGQGQIWTKFWHLLASLHQSPRFFSTNVLKKEFAPEIFSKIGGRHIQSINEIKPSSSKCIFIVSNTKKEMFSCDEVKQHSPHCLILDEVTKKFVASKYETGLLFDNPDFENYKPHFKIFPKEYSPLLAQQILEALKSTYIVLKPINASLGRGILMVEPHQLEQALRIILKKEDYPKTQKDASSFSYWAKDRENFFIAEEFVCSKKIIIDQKPYDPTMRVVFVLFNSAGIPCINFLDSYWKLPAKALTEDGTFTEQHKSHVETKRKCSACVDSNDFEIVKAQLCLLLPQIYLKMLAKYWENEHKDI